MYKLFFLIFFSFNLIYANSMNIFSPNQLKVREKINHDVVDMFYLRQAKEKVNHLNLKSKYSLYATKNEFLNGSNILTARNSKLIEMLSNERLSSRQIEILNVIDQISLNTNQINSSYDCSAIIAHNFSTNGDYISPNISYEECDEINKNFIHFYEFGVFSMKDLNGTILKEFDGRVRLDEVEENPFLSKKIKNSIRDINTLEQKISFLNANELFELSDKISNLNLNNETFITYASIAQAIIIRADILDPNGLNTILNNARTNSLGYAFNTYETGIMNSALQDINQTAELNNRITGLNIDIAKLNTEIPPLISDINASQSNPPPNLPFPPYNIIFANWQSDLNAKLLLLAQKQAQVTQKSILVGIFTSYLDGTIAIPDDFSSTMIQLLRNRISENIFYENILKINLIQSYINRFILNNGTAPNFVNELGINFAAMGVTRANWWPKSFDNLNQEIIFNVNLNNFTVTYSNIFSNTFINSMNLFELNTRRLLLNNLALSPDSIVQNNAGNFNLILPFDLKTIKFVDDILRANLINIPTIATANEQIVANRNNIQNCTAGSSTFQDTLYEPNGNGGMKLLYCDGNAWQDINSIDVYDISTIAPNYRNINITYGTFSDNNISGEIFYQNLNATQAQRVLGINGNFMRIR